jgi:hypothetical protein
VQALAAIAVYVMSLVGPPTTVTCQSAEQWGADPAVRADIALYGFTPAAYTRIGNDTREIALGPFGCRYISQLLLRPGVGDESTRFAEGEALLLLIHESQHAAGWSGEADAECRAVAEFPAAVARLGISPAAARGLATGAAAYHASMPDYYRTGCEGPPTTFTSDLAGSDGTTSPAPQGAGLAGRAQ